MLYFSGNLFDDLLGNGYGIGYMAMKSDILESKGAYLLSIDLPGVLKDDVSLDFNDGILTVSVKKHNDDIKDGEYLSVERYHGACERKYEFADADESNIKAKMSDGVLEIVLAKKEPKETKKTIVIE